MSSDETDRGATALRTAFDRSFALPPRAAEAPSVELLAVRIGGDRYAVRLAELAGVVTARRVVPVPGAVDEVLGLASIRGGFLAVFALRRLLDYPAGPAPRWLLRLASQPTVAVAVDELEGYLRVAATDLGEVDPSRGGLLRGVIRRDDQVCTVIDLDAALAAIRNWTPTSKG